MTCICIAGASQPALDLAAKVLAASGMKLLVSETIESAKKPWLVIEPPNDQLQNSETKAGELPMAAAGLVTSLTPHRLSQVMQAAQSGELAGWASTQNLNALTEWLRIEPTLCFVLVTQKIEDALAQAIDDYDAPFDCEQVIRAWQQNQQKLLHFYYRHRDRCILVNDQDCLENAQEFIRVCKQRLSDRLQLPKTPLSVWPKLNLAVALDFATRVLDSYPEALSLDHELATSVTSFSQASNALLNTHQTYTHHALLMDYRAKREQSQVNVKQWLEENTKLLLKLESVQAENKQLFNQYLDAQRKNEILSEETRADLEVATRLKKDLEWAQAQFAKATVENVEQSKNNERLFFDLDKVQQELEVSFAHNIDVETRVKEIALQQKESQSLAESRLVDLEQALLTNARLQAKHDEVEEKNETLLSQFQQSLIDLETNILKNRALQGTIDTEQVAVKNLEARLLEVTAEYDALSQAHVQWRAERDALIEQIQIKETALQLHHERAEGIAKTNQLHVDALQAKQDELEAENEALSEQAQQALNEIDTYSAENLALQNAISAEKNAVVALLARVGEVTSQFDTISEAHIQWVAEREQLLIQVNDRQTALVDLKQAHESLLLELASAQSLAEQSFIQGEHTASLLEGLEADKRSVEARLSRLLKKFPDPVVCERFEAVGSPLGDQLKTQWQLVGLQTDKLYIPSVLFSTILEDKALGFSMSKAQATTNGLVRWPGILATSSELVVSPVGDATTGPIRAETWLSLATGDLEIVTALMVSLEQELAAGSIEQQFGLSFSNQISTGLKAFKHFSNEATGCFRYDQVRLKRVAIHDDYEHLWLEFDNVLYNDVRSPYFECRVACSELISKRFGSFPKLEFPRLETQQPLNAWYPESTDEFGEKLELRFASPNVFDVAVWQTLTNGDRGFITSLLERLPTILRELDLEQAELQRPWPQWQSVVEHMVRCLETTVVSPPLAETAVSQVYGASVEKSLRLKEDQKVAAFSDQASAKVQVTAAVQTSSPLLKNASRAFVSFFQEA
jgi:hypothetical protein